MRLSQYFMPILRDDPKEAEIISHKLMLRTGMIRQEAAGRQRMPPARDMAQASVLWLAPPAA